MRKWFIAAAIVCNLQAPAQAVRNVDSLQHAVDTARADSFRVRTAQHLFNAVVQSGDLPRARSIVDSQWIWSGRIGYKKGKRLAYTNYGTWYYHQGDLKKALQFYQASYVVSKEMNSPMGMEMGLNNTGVIYRNMGLYDKALDAYNQALVIEREHGFKEDESNTLGNISSIHTTLKNYRKALEILNQSQKLALELHDSTGYAVGLLQEADCSKALGDTVNAMAIIREGIRLAKAVDYKQLQCDALNDYGMMMFELHRYDSALLYYKQALNIGQQIGADNAVMVSLSWMGDAYIARKEYGLAENIIHQAYVLAKAQEDVDSQSDIAASLAVLYDSTRQYQKATHYLNEYVTLHDSIMSREKQETVERLQTQYETAEKEKQIAQLQNQRTAQQAQLNTSRFQLGFLLLTMVLILISSVLWVVYIRNRNRAKALQQTLLLRNMISADLHDDIGSSLSSIATFSDVALVQVKDGMPKCAPLMETISQTAHTTMVNMNDIVWSINPANDAFENILARMQQFAATVLEAKGMQLHFDADEDLFLKKFPLHYRRDFYLLFKEAVNNLSKYSRAANAWITVRLENKKLRLLVRDDGTGFDSSSVSGNGLRTMQSRARAMNGTLNVETGKTGTTVALTVLLP